MMLHTSVALSNPVLLEEALVGTVDPKDTRIQNIKIFQRHCVNWMFMHLAPHHFQL